MQLENDCFQYTGTVFNTLMLHSSALRQFSQRGVQPGTSKVYVKKIYICFVCLM